MASGGEAAGLPGAGEPSPNDGTDIEESAVDRSLLEDVEALIDDGRTYLEAEIAFQKTRAAYVADGAKEALVRGAVAVLLSFMALTGLTVGLIIALTPLLTAWGASALVVAVLLLAAWVFARSAARRFARLMAAIEGERQ